MSILKQLLAAFHITVSYRIYPDLSQIFFLQFPKYISQNSFLEILLDYVTFHSFSPEHFFPESLFIEFLFRSFSLDPFSQSLQLSYHFTNQLPIKLKYIRPNNTERTFWEWILRQTNYGNKFKNCFGRELGRIFDKGGSCQMKLGVIWGKYRK